MYLFKTSCLLITRYVRSVNTELVEIICIGVHVDDMLDKRDQGHEAVADYTQAFLNAEVREGEQLYAQPPVGSDGLWFGECVRPCYSGQDAGKNMFWQVKRTWICSRRARSVSVCEH